MELKSESFDLLRLGTQRYDINSFGAGPAHSKFRFRSKASLSVHSESHYQKSPKLLTFDLCTTISEKNRIWRYISFNKVTVLYKKKTKARARGT